MHNVTTSRHIRSSTELVILVPLKDEFVPITDLVLTYASRVTTVLKTLSEIRQQKVERGFGDPVGPIELLQTIHRVQWTVLEPFDDVKTENDLRTRQLRSPQIMLTSHFDSSWEDYFRDLIKIGGPLLDLIFSHCQGYDRHSCRDNYEAFSDFVRRHQRPCNFLYATAPELTVDDIRYYIRTASVVNEGAGAGAAGSLAVPPVKIEAIKAFKPQQVLDEQTRSAWRSIHALFDLRRRLFLKAGGLTTRERGVIDDRTLYDDAIRSVLEFEPEVVRLGSAAREQIARQGKTGTETELFAALEWVKELLPHTPQLPKPRPLDAARSRVRKPTNPPDPKKLFEDIQGNILSGYTGIKDGRLLFLQCQDGKALQALLRKVQTTITNEAASRAAPKPVRINLAITYSGFKLLGLNEAQLEKFPREFREGMEERAGILGDVAQNHPKLWWLPKRPTDGERIHLSIVHVALIVVGKDQAAIDRAIGQLQLSSSKRWNVVHQLELSPTERIERSQPLPPAPYRVQGTLQPSPLDIQPLGEFLLGYEDRFGDIAAIADPMLKDPMLGLFRNGAFLAMRKMKQDRTKLESYVGSVEQQVRAVAGVGPEVRSTDLRADLIGLIIGRRDNGTMLRALQPGAGLDPNEFDFADDPRGDLCPLHSHIRRSNPRNNPDVADNPRIVRRGLSYQRETSGPEDGEEGLLFMAYCANLALQYELVQRYVNGGNSTGLLSSQNDLLCGVPLDNPLPPPRVVSLSGTVAEAENQGRVSTVALPARKEPFVSLRWGLYFFVPSRAGIKWIVRYKSSTARIDPNAEERGQSRIAELTSLPWSERAHEWKRLLEEIPEADSVQARHAKDVAASITKHHRGAISVRAKASGPGFVVVTTRELARQVLADYKTFSVREYGERLRSSLSDHYLGTDVDDPPNAQGLTYADRSTKANAVMRKISARARVEAYSEATKILDDPGELELDPDGRGADGSRRSTISVRDLASAVVARLCASWLDMPGLDGKTGDRALIESMDRFLIASRRCFQAFPNDQLVKAATCNKKSIEHDYLTRRFPKLAAKISETTLRKSHSHSGRFSSKANDRRKLLPPFDLEDYLKTVSLGAVGFGPPAIGAITRILDQWIESEELWQIQLRSRRGDAIRPKLLEAWSKTPAPPTLFRTAKERVTLHANPPVNIPKGARVIVNLAAVYANALEDPEKYPEEVPEAWLFGGDHGGADGGAMTPRRPPHGCPGREAGLQVIESVVRALLARRSLRRERRFLLSYERETLLNPKLKRRR